MAKKLLTVLQHALSAPDVSAEGQWGYDSARKGMMFHDGVRKRISSCQGFMPYAYPIGGGPGQPASVALNLAANGGSIALPLVLESHMLLDSVTFRNSDSATSRGPVEFALFEDRLDNANALPIVTGAVGTLAAFVPTVGSNRTINVTSPPVYLPPGIYWIALKNNNAAQTVSLSVTSAGTLATNTAQTKTLTTAAFGSTLDLVAATWTKIATIGLVRLNGRVFGQSAAF